MTSGLDGREERPPTPLPPGFGISNLRITLGRDTDDAAGSLRYAGALDHLLTRPSPGFPEDELLHLARHAESLRAIARDLGRLRRLLPISATCQVRRGGAEVATAI